MEFENSIDRRNTNSVKWDSSEDERMLPMWIADMDFRVPPSIEKALADRVGQGIFGYARIPETFQIAVRNWWREFHGLNVESTLIVPVADVLSAIIEIIKTYLKPGHKVIVQPPVYNRFFEAIRNCDCTVVENNLKRVDGSYGFDFENLANLATDSETKLLLLCNPHNPVGRSWRESELDQIAKICSENNLIVISDEVHADLVLGDLQHVPFASLAEKHGVSCFTCGSPGKPFNLSGLQAAYIICHNSKMKIAFEGRMDGAKELNVFAVEGLIAAYTSENYQWLQRLKAYLKENFSCLKQFLNSRFPEITVTNLEATYLVWLDCSKSGFSSQEIQGHLLQAEKLWVVPGDIFGRAGEGFLRINIACPRKVLEEGLLRFERGYSSLLNKKATERQTVE